jgi:hypothetical protein
VRKILWVTIFVLSVAGFFPGAYAGLSVTPGIIEIIAARNDEATGVCEVTNTAEGTINVTVQPENWKRGPDGRRGGTVAHWLTVEPQALDLGPGEVGKFTYSLQVPADGAGEYVAQIFFTEASEGGGTQISTRVGVVLYMAVRETIQLEAEIAKLKMSVFPDGNASVATAQVEVHNTGNVHIRPTGDVKVYDQKGDFVVAAILNTGWGILPGELYTYQGTGRGPKILPGQYKAVATMQYGDLFKEAKGYTKELYFEIGVEGRVEEEAGT